MKNEEGFTLVEVMVAIVVVAIGLLAMQAMQGRAINENSLSGAIGQKTMMAAGQIETILSLDYDDPLLDDVDLDGTNQDTDLDGRDNDDDNNLSVTGVNEDFGLRHWECCPGNVDPRGNPVPGCLRVADHCAFDPNMEYEVYWNIAPDYPIENTKTINVIVVDSRDKADTNTEAVNRAEYRYVKDNII